MTPKLCFDLDVPGVHGVNIETLADGRTVGCTLLLDLGFQEALARYGDGTPVILTGNFLSMEVQHPTYAGCWVEFRLQDLDPDQPAYGAQWKPGQDLRVEPYHELESAFFEGTDGPEDDFDYNYADSQFPGIVI